MAKDRNVCNADTGDKSLIVHGSLYETRHHPRIRERRYVETCSYIEVHAVKGFAIEIVSEEEGSMWLKVRRVAP